MVFDQEDIISLFLSFPIVYADISKYQRYNLNLLSEKEIKKQRGDVSNPSSIYRSVEEWFKNEK